MDWENCPTLPVARDGFCALVALISSLLPAPTVEACTRAVYHGLEDRYLTGRTFDWRAEITSNLWIFPRGISYVHISLLVAGLALNGPLNPPKLGDFETPAPPELGGKRGQMQHCGPR